MRGPNSRRTLRATSCTVFSLTIAFYVLSIVVLAIPASTRSVTGRHGSRTDDHEVVDVKLITDIIANDEEPTEIGKVDEPEDHGISKRDRADKDVTTNENPPIVEPTPERITIGKSSVNSEFDGAKTIDESSKKKSEEGIRRFDGVVANEDGGEKNLGKSVESLREISEIDKTVMKGIIVRDAPIAFDIDPEQPDPVSEAVELDGYKVNRKRSLADSGLAGETVESTEVEPSGVESAANDAREKIADSPDSRRLPALVPVGSSPAKLARAENSAAAETSVPRERETVADRFANVESSARDQSEIRVSEEIAAESVEARGESVETIADVRESAKTEEIVVLEPKTIIMYDDGLGRVVDNSEIGKDEVSGAGKSLPIFDADENDEEENDKRMVRSDGEPNVVEGISKSAEIDESSEKREILRTATIDDRDASALSALMKTDESRDVLKAQAIALQQKIKDKIYLDGLREQTTEILPGIPNFTEIQLLDALKSIVPSEKSEDMAESSYLPKINNSILNSNEIQILQLTETLLARQERPTFIQNMMDCIVGLSVLNCMKIFIWPIVADNIPAFAQNLPMLPIEITPSDWLPGNQQNIPKVTRSRSASSNHQQRLITPEVVVSGILTDALKADPTKITDSMPTHIGIQNETLSKWLTPGQLEILKMAEKFLPENSRSEYSNKMSSCVRRFEYFSCIKYFAWPMVKQHYPALPDFPDYQSWYPTVTLYPSYPILPYPNADGIGELPEVVEADSVRTRSPRPEAVIVQILENVLRQTPGYLGHQTYQARKPGHIVAPITPDQMAIFYTAEQLIPVQLRADYMAKTMNCIRDYNYLTCTKYSTWPTVRQWWPSLPDFPDLSSLIATFAIPELPDFSQYIPDFSTLIPNWPGTTQPQPAPAPEPTPDQSPQEANVTIQSKEHKSSVTASPIENRIIQILSNIRWYPLARNIQPVASVTPESLAVLRTLSYNQLRILGLAKNALPGPVRGDLDSRFVGCLQGGSDFISCTRNVIWPTLQFYVKDMPSFPEEPSKPEAPKFSEATHGLPVLKPGIYQPIFNPVARPVYSEISDQIAARSPTGGQIIAEPEESAIPLSRPQASSPQTSHDHPTGLDPAATLRQGPSAKSNDPSLPVISVTDTRFTPIYSDHPESLLLKILATIQSSSKYVDNSYAYEKPGSVEFPNVQLNTDQKNVIRVAESLLPEDAKPEYTERLKRCLSKSSFLVCSREIVWPSLVPYYQRLPSFPNFYINDSIDPNDAENSGIEQSIAPGVTPISETDVKTGQHGDTLLTITDTRFVPIYSQHPESVILTILKNVQSTSPNVLTEPSATKTGTRSPEFTSSFTDQQGNIVTVAENLLPESIREVFAKRMSECAKENSFLACTRDIAWPTIAQFFPRLPNFPNIGDLTDYIVEKPQQRPALLPPHLEPVVKPSLAQEDPVVAAPIGNLIPITPEDVESRIEATLQQISGRSSTIQRKFSFLNTKDPAIGSYVTERQANIIQLSEDVLPYSVKPVFVGQMMDCARSGNVFPNCVREVGWPLLRQYIPNIPDLPDLGTYFPQLPLEIPQIPQFPDYQIPQIQPIPGFDGFQLAGQGFPLRASQDQIGQDASLISPSQSQSLPSGVYLSGIQGLTPSVESASTVYSGASGSSRLSPAVVPGFPDQPTGLLSEVPSERRRQRRHVGDEPSAINRNISIDNSSSQLGSNITESQFLEILVNLTKLNRNDTKNPDKYPIEAINSTTMNSLTSEQSAILEIVANISSQTDRGVMSQVFQCIRSLSFLRCMGIFVWPVITQNVPSLPGISSLSSFNPFGRSSEEKDSFEYMFGMSSDDFEKELLEKKDSVEKFLKDWYRDIVEKKYDDDYGFLRVRGHGDGEIGLSFGGLKRRGRGAKLKDSKNMPSILTIISDIMEDVLEQRETRIEKKDNGKRERSLREESDDYNRVFAEPDRSVDSERSSNDDQIIAMFIDKMKVNGSDVEELGKVDDDRYLNDRDAYEAFELLFGTRLSEKMADKLRDIEKNRYTVDDESRASSMIGIDEERSVKNFESEQTTTKKTMRSGLMLRLPEMNEEFVGRRITSGLVDLGRKMKMQMSQLVPGISFIISFFVQMALAHARAAASVAGMMSNMALGSAMLSMVRQAFFGSTSDSKVKHVWDNPAMGPGITWPSHNYHG